MRKHIREDVLKPLSYGLEQDVPIEAVIECNFKLITDKSGKKASRELRTIERSMIYEFPSGTVGTWGENLVKLFIHFYLDYKDKVLHEMNFYTKDEIEFGIKKLIKLTEDSTYTNDQKEAIKDLLHNTLLDNDERAPYIEYKHEDGFFSLITNGSLKTIIEEHFDDICQYFSTYRTEIAKYVDKNEADFNDFMKKSNYKVSDYVVYSQSYLIEYMKKNLHTLFEYFNSDNRIEVRKLFYFIGNK